MRRAAAAPAAQLVTVLLCATVRASEAPYPASDVTRVVILGSGTPNADPDRSGPALAVVVRGVPYLVDCGPGVVRRAAAAHARGIEGLAVSRLSRVFITHLHSDHTAGLPDLWLTPWVLERRDPLEVWGPKGVARMASHLREAYKEDVEVRRKGGEPSNPTGWKLVAHEIEPGVVYRDSNVTVTAFAVRHGTWKHAFGFRFDTPDRRIVVSGDCAPTPAVADACDGCDILVHEVYSQAGFERRPPEWQRYHAAFHTSSRQLAELATRARPKLLVLTHQLFWGTPEDSLVQEVRSGYRGDVVSAHDLDSF
jgi:ribonuclease BN (tRNA processing enzyme)